MTPDTKHTGTARTKAHPLVDDLTPAERRVADLVAEGLANKEIAQALFVSVHTVEVHLSHAYAKLGIRSRVQLALRWALAGTAPANA